MSTHNYFLAFLLPLLLALCVRPAYACTYSIPVVGRWSALQIGLIIPSTPSWARTLILNAARAWNLAQLWFQQNYFPEGNVFTFVASPFGNVTISYGLPAGFASIAVGWTQYAMYGSSTIATAHVFLDGSVFNDPREPNTTGLDLGFRLALHELGRVLGLGSLVDGSDVMDPVGTVLRADQPPIISFIDLFALHVLASEPSLSTLTIVLSTDQKVFVNAWNLVGASLNNQPPAPSGNGAVGPAKLAKAKLRGRLFCRCVGAVRFPCMAA